MAIGAGIHQHPLGRRAVQLRLNPTPILTTQMIEDRSSSVRAVASNTLMASTRLIQVVESFRQNGRCSGDKPGATGQNALTQSLLMRPDVQTSDSKLSVADHSYSTLDTAPNIESTPAEPIEAVTNAGQCSDQPLTIKDVVLNPSINASDQQVQQINTGNIGEIRAHSGKRIMDIGELGLPMMINTSDVEPGIMWSETASDFDTAILDLSAHNVQEEYSGMESDTGEEVLQDKLPELIGYGLVRDIKDTDETTETGVPDDSAGADKTLASSRLGTLVKAEPFSSSLASIVNDEELFDELHTSLFPELDTELSNEEVGQMLSGGSHFITGTDELLKPWLATSPGSIRSLSEKSPDSESVHSDDSDSEISIGENTIVPDHGIASRAQLLADPGIERVFQVTSELPSFYSSPVVPAMLANITETAGEDELGAKVRKRRRPEHYEVAGASKGKNKKANSHPDKCLIGFLFQELYLPNEKRIIHWEIEKEGIYRVDRLEMGKLAKRWGDKKNNKKMTYDKFHRAIRGNYKTETNAGVITHLIYGIDGKSTKNIRSPYYQFDLDDQKVKDLMEYFKT